MKKKYNFLKIWKLRKLSVCLSFFVCMCLSICQVEQYWFDSWREKLIKSLFLNRCNSAFRTNKLNLKKKMLESVWKAIFIYQNFNIFHAELLQTKKLSLKPLFHEVKHRFSLNYNASADYTFVNYKWSELEIWDWSWMEDNSIRIIINLFVVFQKVAFKNQNNKNKFL